MVFPVMRASALRTGEVHGLAYRDVQSDEPPGRTVVRGSLYQNLKTTKARRRSSLKGAHQDLAMRKAQEWKSAARLREGSTHRRSAPAFSDLATESGRLDRNDLFGRVGELLRWATGLPDARPYWLRKSAARERFIDLMASARTSLWSLRAFLGELGHGSVRVTLGHYIHDPLPPFLSWFDEAPDESGAARIAFAAGLSKSRVSRDLGSNRSKLVRNRFRARVAHLLGPVGFSIEGGSYVRLPEPPKVTSIFHPTLRQLDVVMRRVAEGRAIAEVTALDRWPTATTAALEAATRQLLDPYQIGFGDSPTTVRVTPPRGLSRASKVLEMLDDEDVAPVLAEIAERWIGLAAAGFPPGFPGTASDWVRWIEGIPLLNDGQWEECRKGAYQVRVPRTGTEGVGTWPALLWISLLAWLWLALRPRTST